MVSVFIEGTPANLRIAKAICADNRDRDASYLFFGFQIRLKAKDKLILYRASIERAIERALSEDEWRSVMWNHTGRITGIERDKIVFEDSEETKMLDEYWDRRLNAIKDTMDFLNSECK